MKVYPVSAFNDNYIWLIVNEEKRTALCVDPGDATPVLAFLEQEGLELIAILLTHHHHDHIDGVNELCHAIPGIAVYGPKDPRITNTTDTIQEGELLSLSSCQFQILDTPGHTATHISLYEPYYGWLFCGDTLFSAGCGRVFDGTYEQLYTSLEKLKLLPDSTEVYCAHEYTRRNLRFAAMIEPDNLAIRHHAHKLLEGGNQCSLPSSLALEKKINPFLRTDNPAVQIYAKERGTKSLDPLSVFVQIRRDKDTFP